MSAVRGRRSQVVEEESYFISMSDLMVGLLFVFMVLLVYFSLQFRQVHEQYVGGNEARAEIVEDLEGRLKNRGVPVIVEPHKGILRLPEDLLFASGQAELNAEGMRAISIVAEELDAVLPCYSFPRSSDDCGQSSHTLEALFVEGHTDSDRMSGRGFIRDNLDLSAMRATNTFRALVRAQPGLLAYRNAAGDDGSQILSVSGYGFSRPVADEATEEGKAKNRRIDLRFLMSPPSAEAASSDPAVRVNENAS